MRKNHCRKDVSPQPKCEFCLSTLSAPQKRLVIEEPLVVFGDSGRVPDREPVGAEAQKPEEQQV